jgi:hypothetical protein
MLDAASLAATQRSQQAVAPLRFVPGAARSGPLVFRGDAASLALSAVAETAPWSPSSSVLLPTSP